MTDEATPPKPSPEEERARALELLRAAHKFPVQYEVSVITFSSPEIVLAVRMAAGLPLDADEHHQIVPSSAGKYTSHRIKVPCESAEQVLDLYARLRAINGVVTLL